MLAASVKSPGDVPNKSNADQVIAGWEEAAGLHIVVTTVGKTEDISFVVLMAVVQKDFYVKVVVQTTVA